MGPCSSTPPSQPRNPPEPKNKSVQWPQAEDLRKLHAQYCEHVEKALEAAHNDGVKQWCQPRTERDEENDGQDIRQWQEMFKIMENYGSSGETTVLELSNGLVPSIHC
jgi:hypothetical protein